jgi:hypothetical protein
VPEPIIPPAPCDTHVPRPARQPTGADRLVVALVDLVVPARRADRAAALQFLAAHWCPRCGGSLAMQDCSCPPAAPPAAFGGWGFRFTP